MRLKSRITEVLLAFLSIISPAIAFAQVNPTSPVPQRESIQELLNRLTPQQKQQFDNAGKSYKENQFVEAFAIYKRLLTELSGDAILSKFASEAGLNSGDQSFALTILKPLAQADPDDWQAAAPLTRACAESGDMSCRDSGMVHIDRKSTRLNSSHGYISYAVFCLKKKKKKKNYIILCLIVRVFSPHIPQPAHTSDI